MQFSPLLEDWRGHGLFLIAGKRLSSSRHGYPDRELFGFLRDLFQGAVYLDLGVCWMMAGQDISSVNRRCRAASAARSMRCAPMSGATGAWPSCAESPACPRRTLQRQFLDFLGKTPRAVLRDIGFERARRELLQGACRRQGHGCRAALRLRRISAGSPIEYRRRYGETPSQTLKRQAVFDRRARRHALAACAPLRDRPALAFGADRGRSRITRRSRAIIADELATALTRAGVAVAGPSRIGALPSDRRDPGIGPADAPDLPADRRRNRPPALGASLRRRARR